MGAAQPVLSALAAMFLAATMHAVPPRTSDVDREAAVGESYRALTTALGRAEFESAETIAARISSTGADTLAARKAAALSRLAKFLRTADAAAIPQNGVIAEAGALRLSLAPDLSFAAAALGERGVAPLLFGHPAPFTSRVSLLVDGEAIVPSSAASLGAGRGFVEGRLIERGVELFVSLRGEAPPSWHPAAEAAAMRLEVVVTNRSERPRTIGARLLLDLVDGFDDAPTPRIGVGEAMGFTSEWIHDAVPRRISFGSRSVILRGVGAPAPERALLVPLALAESTAFDFALRDDLPLGADSALALYAEPRVLAPGESRTIACELKPDADDVDATQPLGLALFTEPVAGDSRATRVLLLLRAGARGTIGDAPSVVVTPRIAAGLETIESAPDLGSLGALQRGVTVQRSLVVRADLTRGGGLEVAFDVAADLDGVGVRDSQSRRVATTIGVPGAVTLAGRVVDPMNKAVPHCEIVVKQGGREVARGRSNEAGNYRFDGLAPSPCEVLASRVVYSEPSAKAARAALDDVLLDVLLTSETIDDQGFHRLPIVAPGEGRDIVLARALTRYSLLVVVEWDATREYLEGLARGMRKAAEFLYAASDGHFTFGRVAIRDCGRDWNHADLWDWANNSVHPNASVGGIRHRYHPRFAPWNTAINFGRQWDSTWEGGGLFTTVVHEFGHYGFGLFDEYLGAPQGAYRNLSYPEMCRCIMGYQYSDHKICYAANHRGYTNQGMFNGRSCWEQLEANHEGDRGGFFAAVTTPAERRGVTPPPVSNQLGAALRVVIDDHSTGGRDVPLEIVGPFGSAPAGVPVYTESEVEGRTVYHGVTNGAGRLTLMGVHEGDRVSAAYSGARAERALGASTQAQRLEFGAEPRDGALAPLVAFHPDAQNRNGRFEFAGGAIEAKLGRGTSRLLAVNALRPSRRSLRVDAIPDGRFAALAGATELPAGRGAFEVVIEDAVDGDGVSLVDVVVGEGECHSFDGSVGVEAPPGVLLSIASTSGPPWLGKDLTVIGRVHAITSAGETRHPIVVVLDPPAVGEPFELRSVDPDSRVTLPLEVEDLIGGRKRVRTTVPTVLVWCARD